MEAVFDLTSILSFANPILSSAIVIIAFSLFISIFTHNLGSSVARSFCALIAFVAVVYMGDVLLPKVDAPEAVTFWLRFQWLGIAFAPAAYLHFSDSLLRTTTSRRAPAGPRIWPARRRRRWPGSWPGRAFGAKAR